jgi:hypothetical protein
LALVLAAAPLAAQAPGLPIHGGGMAPGLELTATLGLADDDSWSGKGTGYGVTVSYAWRRLALAATIAGFDPQAAGAASTVSVGALADVRLMGDGVETPLGVHLFGGYGRFERPQDMTSLALLAYLDGDWRVPLGAAFSLTIPTPVVSLRPWLAPRMELWNRTDAAGSATRAALAGSAGVDLRFLGGVSLRILWDGIVDEGQTLGVGAAFHF